MIISSKIVEPFDNWIQTKESSIVLMIESLRMKIMEVHMQEVAASRGIPCMHAIAVFSMLGRSSYDHYSKFFRSKATS
jgi:hypothetical protein